MKREIIQRLLGSYNAVYACKEVTDYYLCCKTMGSGFTFYQRDEILIRGIHIGEEDVHDKELFDGDVPKKIVGVEVSNGMFGYEWILNFASYRTENIIMANRYFRQVHNIYAKKGEDIYKFEDVGEAVIDIAQNEVPIIIGAEAASKEIKVVYGKRNRFSGKYYLKEEREIKVFRSNSSGVICYYIEDVEKRWGDKSENINFLKVNFGVDDVSFSEENELDSTARESVFGGLGIIVLSNSWAEAIAGGNSEVGRKVIWEKIGESENIERGKEITIGEDTEDEIGKDDENVVYKDTENEEVWGLFGGI
jgi:hypothetical protein